MVVERVSLATVTKFIGGKLVVQTVLVSTVAKSVCE